MQTIKVTIKTEDNITGFYAACKRPFAHVSPDFYHKGKFAGYYGVWASCDNKTFADAIEFIGNEIERYFAAFGLNVEFVNA